MMINIVVESKVIEKKTSEFYKYVYIHLARNRIRKSVEGIRKKDNIIQFAIRLISFNHCNERNDEPGGDVEYLDQTKHNNDINNNIVNINVRYIHQYNQQFLLVLFHTFFPLPRSCSPFPNLISITTIIILTPKRELFTKPSSYKGEHNK